MVQVADEELGAGPGQRREKLFVCLELFAVEQAAVGELAEEGVGLVKVASRKKDSDGCWHTGIECQCDRNRLCAPRSRKQEKEGKKKLINLFMLAKREGRCQLSSVSITVRRGCQEG